MSEELMRRGREGKGRGERKGGSDEEAVRREGRRKSNEEGEYFFM